MCHPSFPLAQCPPSLAGLDWDPSPADSDWRPNPAAPPTPAGFGTPAIPVGCIDQRSMPVGRVGLPSFPDWAAVPSLAGGTGWGPIPAGKDLPPSLAGRAADPSLAGGIGSGPSLAGGTGSGPSPAGKDLPPSPVGRAAVPNLAAGTGHSSRHTDLSEDSTLARYRPADTGSSPAGTGRSGSHPAADTADRRRGFANRPARQGSVVSRRCFLAAPGWVHGPAPQQSLNRTAQGSALSHCRQSGHRRGDSPCRIHRQPRFILPLSVSVNAPV